MMFSAERVNWKSDMSMVLDALESWGCVAIFGKEWFQLQWESLEIASQTITVKELLPIVIAAVLWGHHWQGETAQTQCDNEAVVAILGSRTSREPEAMHMLRCLAFLEAKYYFQLFAIHI